MKNLLSTTARFTSLAWLALVFFTVNLCAQNTATTAPNTLAEPINHGCDHHDDADENRSEVPPSGAHFQTFAPSSAAPGIQLSLYPSNVAGDTLLYETVAGWTGSGEAKAQVSIRHYIQNIQATDIYLYKVIFSYTQNGVAKQKLVLLAPIDTFPVGTAHTWQNGRAYHAAGDVLYLDAPIPATLTIGLYFVGYSTPVTVTVALAPYTKTFGMPFRAFDLASNEVWQGGSTHGGGMQVFAYDMSVEGLTNGVWSRILPGTDGSINQHYRCWGKPVYAMADGVVMEAVNTVPTNPAPNQLANFSGYPNGGGGNHFYIQHGEDIALYAHMQPGSLNPQLVVPGTIVHKGDFLGLTGNSGNSSEPHLHVHVRKETTIETGEYRPLLFNTGWVIQKSSFPSLSSSANWFKLSAHGLPGFAGNRAFIWPSNTKPLYNDNVYTSVWRSANASAEVLWTGASAALLTTKDNDFKALGYRMTKLSVVRVGTALQYSAVWRAGSGASTLQVGTSWAVFSAQWSALSSQGQRLLDLAIFKDANGNIKYAGVYGAGNWGHYLYISQSQAQFSALWSSLNGQGYRLVDLEVYNVLGVQFYAGVWKAGSGLNALVYANSWAQFTQNWNTLNGQGVRLVDMDTDNTGPNTVYTGTFLAGNDGCALWESSYNSIMSKWEHYHDQGLRLVDFNVRPGSGTTLAGADDRDGGSPESQVLFGENGTENQAIASDLQISPNPVSDVFTVKSELEILDWTLSNALGQAVRRGENEAAGSSSCSVQVSGLNPGIYTLNARTVGGIQSKQVEIVRQ